VPGQVTEKRRGLAVRVSLAVASVALVFCTAEIGMRIAGLGEVMTYRADSRFGYLMRPSQRVSTYGDVIEINSLGLRGPELADPKPPGVIRILFLGDSITYGGGRIPERDLFCRRIEALAANDGLRVESANASAPGWSPQNWAAWVAANGIVGADLVVPVIPAIDRARPLAAAAEYGVAQHPPLLRLTTLWLKLQAMRMPRVPLTDEAMAANVRAISDVLARLGAIPRLAVFVPSRDVDERPERWAPYEALFPDALDLRAGFSPGDFLDDVHFSVSGHRKLAEDIYARLRPRLASLSRQPDAARSRAAGSPTTR
jgi:lysophospholipase L1-like esterase